MRSQGTTQPSTAATGRALPVGGPVRWLLSVGLALGWLAAIGCGGSRSSAEIELGSVPYATAFHEAALVLRAHRFDLDRVDARAGVVTTRPAGSAGIATPWSRFQSRPAQELDELLSQQTRVARVYFRLASADGAAAEAEPALLRPLAFEPPPERGAASAPGPEGLDLRTAAGPVIATVEVVVYRTQRVGVRSDPTSIRLESATFDPALAQRELFPRYDVAVERDQALAGRLADAIRRRVGLEPVKLQPE